MPNFRVNSFVEGLSTESFDQLCELLRIPKEFTNKAETVAQRFDSVLRLAATMKFIVNWRTTSSADKV
jgi:hypothetical protein